MIILRFTGEGELFFRQSRVGRRGKPFDLIKFATMLKDSPNLGTGTITLTDDPRVLPFGKFLRATKINELPQLINILKGDMSLIGPRPQTRRCFDAFPERSQREIIKVRPGLSGIGSVAFRAEERMMGDADNADRLYDEVIMPYKGRLEEWYVAHQGLQTYFLLIFVTVWVVVFPKSRLFWRVFNKLPSPPKDLEPYF
jgi:lipopolysaccharide/colanic/teichoic acid biosynthesis glycosyltransferase